MALKTLDLYTVKKTANGYTTAATGEQVKINENQVVMVKDLDLVLEPEATAVCKVYLSNGTTIIAEQGKIS